MTASAAFISLLAAVIIQAVYIIKGKPESDKISHFLLLISALLLFSITLYRSITIRFVAVTNTFESLIFFSGFICLLLFILKLKHTEGKSFEFVQFGSSMIALVLLSVASSPLAPKQIAPPIPALNSYWLVLHVTFSFIGESFFALSFVTALAALITKNTEKKNTYELLTAKFIALGYPVFTAGALIFGAVWARYAWGSFWSWDPKETWALITWLVYTAYLHIRFAGKPKRRTAAFLAVTGFVFTLFTFFGVNFLLAGLHSYG